MSFTESSESFRVLSECHQRFIQFHSENYQRFIQFHSENYQRVIQRVMRVSENHQKVIRLSWKTSEIIRRSSEGHHKVISRLSGGHQRVIRGSSGGHQKSIYFSSQICIALKLFWLQVSFQKLFWALMNFFSPFFQQYVPLYGCCSSRLHEYVTKRFQAPESATRFKYWWSIFTVTHFLSFTSSWESNCSSK